jgi:hypothetical protein
MAAGGAGQTAAVLNVLADLSPSAQQEAGGLAVPTAWFHWMNISAVGMFVPRAIPASDIRPNGRFGGAAWPPIRDPKLVREMAATPIAAQIERDIGERLASVDQIRTGHHALRVGWLFVAGRRPLPDGRMQRVFHPLLSAPVRVQVPPIWGMATVTVTGDTTITDRVADRDLRNELEATYEIGGGALDNYSTPFVDMALLQRLDRLRAFALRAARAAGFEVGKLVSATESPDAFLRREGLVVVAGVGVYTTDEVGDVSPAAALREWAGRSLGTSTALHTLYFGQTGGEQASDDPIVSPFPLTLAQREAVTRSRQDPVSVVSGAPGTGKSHTVAAIACEALRRNETVLVAAKSEAAVDALLDLLDNAPGPDPVVFGSSERRDALADRLGAGELRATNKDALEQARRSVSRAMRDRAALAGEIACQLDAEAYLSGRTGDENWARREAPDLFDPRCDADDVRRLLALAARQGGWWTRRKARRAYARALERAGATDLALEELTVALTTACNARAAADLVQAGGLDLSAQWTQLADIEDELERRVGTWLELASRSSERLNSSTFPAIAVLATALRSGRAARRTQLGRLDRRLTRALPLWVGTLADIEDLLPAMPGLFDLVILDEASAIDQPLAAPALLRSRRAVIVGDPHQLRHVSFLADDQLRVAAATHGVDDPVLVGRLDVRRNSIFDVAVGAAHATVLDEHFRSAPHLIEFVARRLYGGRLHVATRSPATESCDCIEVLRLTARRDKGGVVREEVEEILRRLRELQRDGASSVGVITPFRAQADAIEEALLEELTLQELEALDLRVGTVHAFQGNERNVVLVSLGVGEDGAANSWRFVEDPHLFAVLATRAREKLVMILSAEPPARGLVADYLAQADAPPGRPVAVGASDAWTAEIAQALDAAEVPTISGYPVGRHVVDVCAGDAAHFIGVETLVHPDGPEAHIERHLSLVRAGWDIVEAHRSRWGDRAGEFLVPLIDRLRG